MWYVDNFIKVTEISNILLEFKLECHSISMRPE